MPHYVTVDLSDNFYLVQMLYTKLFIVMGILWMAECLEFLLQTKHHQVVRMLMVILGGQDTDGNTW
jgi:hypothetical protein